MVVGWSDVSEVTEVHKKQKQNFAAALRFYTPRSSAVAKKPRDASCLPVVSFVALIERCFLLLVIVTSASDLLVHKFDSVLLSSA